MDTDLAHKHKASTDIYRMAVLFDQYTVSSLTNCLVDFKQLKL